MEFTPPHIATKRRNISSLNEVFGIAREAGIRAEDFAHKLSGKSSWAAGEGIAAIERAAPGPGRHAGSICLHASSTGISQLVPDTCAKAETQGTLADRAKSRPDRRDEGPP